jgi:hypothetical protein
MKLKTKFKGDMMKMKTIDTAKLAEMMDVLYNHGIRCGTHDSSSATRAQQYAEGVPTADHFPEHLERETIIYIDDESILVEAADKVQVSVGATALFVFTFFNDTDYAIQSAPLPGLVRVELNKLIIREEMNNITANQAKEIFETIKGASRQISYVVEHDDNVLLQSTGNYVNQALMLDNDTLSISIGTVNIELAGGSHRFTANIMPDMVIVDVVSNKDIIYRFHSSIVDTGQRNHTKEIIG